MVDARFLKVSSAIGPLTFRDCTIVKEPFRNILIGVYHSRIEYPEGKKDVPKVAEVVAGNL